MTDAVSGRLRPSRMDDRMLVGDGVRLRALRREDVPVVVEHYNDRDVVSFLAFWEAPMGEFDAEQWFERATKTPPAERSMAIATLPGDEFVGVVGVTVAWRPRLARLGIALWDPAARGRGIGTEAVRLMVRHCFETLNLHRVELDVFANNPRAIRAYEKAGFVHEGTRRHAWFWDGQWVDVHVMGVLREG